MNVSGRVAVVTGGASGIGRALCLALANAGTEAVVVADLDGPGADRVAAQITSGGHRAQGVAVDVADPAQVKDFVATVTREFGRIDLLCSNAGIIVRGGVELSDEAWERTWAVNVQSHIRLARAVLPAMLERGDGYFVFTASAAGLLTQLDSAPYAVTKHAAVALAEWLSITHGDQGIKVSCLCPQAVTSNLGETSRRQVPGAPALAPDASAARQAAVDGVLEPEDVAATVLEGIASERFLILPHPEVADYERRRTGDRDRWLRGMRRLQSKLSTRS